MPVEANLQKILIRHINFDTQNKSATSHSSLRERLTPSRYFLMAFASGDILTVANVSCVVTEKQESVKLALWTSIPT